MQPSGVQFFSDSQRSQYLLRFLKKDIKLILRGQLPLFTDPPQPRLNPRTLHCNYSATIPHSGITTRPRPVPSAVS